MDEQDPTSKLPAVRHPTAGPTPPAKRQAESAEARVRRLILERRSRFMAAALAGLGVGAQAGCEGSQQQPAEGDTATAGEPEEPRVCLRIMPEEPSVCLSPAVPPVPVAPPPTPNVCLSAPMPPSVCLQPPIPPEPPSVCLSPPWEPPEPTDAGVPTGTDAGSPDADAGLSGSDAGHTEPSVCLTIALPEDAGASQRDGSADAEDPQDPKTPGDSIA